MVIEALNWALGHRQVEPEWLLVHTDQGSQYRATDYHDRLREQKSVCSMSAKGCYWDNAVFESFFFKLKPELDLDDNREPLIAPRCCSVICPSGSKITTNANGSIQRSASSARSTKGSGALLLFTHPVNP